MKFKDQEEMKKEVELLGLAALSKFSSISYLSKLNIALEGMLLIESKIREIECGLWSLVPLAGCDENQDIFKGHLENLTNKFNSFIKSVKVMNLARNLKE